VIAWSHNCLSYGHACLLDMPYAADDGGSDENGRSERLDPGRLERIVDRLDDLVRLDILPLHYQK